MSKNHKTIRRLPLIAAYLGAVIVMLACTVFGIGRQPDDDSLLRLDDEVLEVRDEEGDWTPVAGEATFTLIGELQSLDPWEVAGVSLETNEATQIEESLEVGDLVRVQGTVLEDGTWVAYSIGPAEQQTDPIITLIGVVDSIDPWAVNGIQLNVTDETEIKGEVTVGTIVRVEILLLKDGTWEVLSIAPLAESIETSGCVTVIATVLSVDGDEVQFLGWPVTVTLGDDEKTEDNEENEDSEGEDEEEDGDEDEAEMEVTLSPRQVVMAVVCISDDGRLIVVQIILLEDEDDDNGDAAGGEKVLVCHKPNKNAHTLSIAPAAVPAHLAHGDTLGPCP